VGIASTDHPMTRAPDRQGVSLVNPFSCQRFPLRLRRFPQ